MKDPTLSSRVELAGLARLFGKLGFVAFGGPAAHVALMREEVVERRGWMGEQEFLDLFGATNLIPGPNSTELAIHIGRVRAGWRGLLVAGACFILPAAVMVLVLAWAYDLYGSTPAVEGLLYGILPVVIAVIAKALWGLLRTVVKGPLLALIGVAALTLYLLGVAEIPLLAGGAVVVLAAREVRRRWGGETAAFVPLAPFGLLASPPALAGIGGVFFSFLKIGAVLFGSGYVLLAFLRSEFVGTGLLTEQQLLDAVAIGQFTPGPVFTTATFIGYLLEGVPGAIVATVGIFLPAFVLVAVTGPFIARLRDSSTASSLLDGVNAVSLALMAGVTLQLGQTAIADPFTVLLALAALALLFRGVGSAWLIAGGGILGLAVGSLATPQLLSGWAF